MSCVRSFEPIEKPSEVLEELVGQNGVRRHFTHHHQLQAVFAALEAILTKHAHHALRLTQRTHERHHDLDVRQAHLVTHALQCTAFHLEGFGEVFEM